MALFKISKGESNRLPSTYHEGYAYFTTDDGKFYIDTTNTAAGRIVLNALKADQDSNGNIITDTYLPLSGGILTNYIELANKNYTVTDNLNHTVLSIYQPAADSYSVSSTPVEGDYYYPSRARNTVIEFKINYPNSYQYFDGSKYIKSAWQAGLTSFYIRQYQIVGSSGIVSDKYIDIYFPGQNLVAQTSSTLSNKTYQLSYINKDSGVGNSSTPVYVNSYGEIKACTDISTVGLTHIGNDAPTSTNYVLWVDEDEADSLAMRADAIKYKAFSITTGSWSGAGPYTYTMTATGITENSAILNLTLDATSQTYQKAQLDWETGANTITLSTATKPTGTISGYLIATEVTVI